MKRENKYLLCVCFVFFVFCFGGYSYPAGICLNFLLGLSSFGFPNFTKTKYTIHTKNNNLTKSRQSHLDFKCSLLILNSMA